MSKNVIHDIFTLEQLQISAHFEGLETLRIKETDRLAALETELRRLGADARAGADELVVRPGPLRGAPGPGCKSR